MAAATKSRRKSSRSSVSPEERAARRRALRAEMEQAIEELASSEGWERWLTTRVRFHRYSFANRILIGRQCPDATHVAGFRTWLELGRHVRKGERGIAIWSHPFTVSRERETPSGETEVDSFQAYRIVYVFDISQTDGDELPRPADVRMDGDELAPRLVELERMAERLGFTVSYEDLGDSVAAPGGWCDRSARSIVISTGQSVNQQVRTLVHELAHAQGVGSSEYGRREAETIVESVAFVVCGLLGVDSSCYSIPYVANWGDADAAALRARGELVDELVRSFEDALQLDADAGREVEEAAA